jgi:hypothetical protein
MEWEFIKTIEHGFMRNRECIKCLEIPGGWLVKYIDFAGTKGPARHATVYVPDCEKEWDVTKEPIKLEQFVLKKNPNYNERTCRIKVPGGWVVMDGHYLSGGAQSHISLVFVPDPNHQWETQEPQKE